MVEWRLGVPRFVPLLGMREASPPPEQRRWAWPAPVKEEKGKLRVVLPKKLLLSPVETAFSKGLRIRPLILRGHGGKSDGSFGTETGVLKTLAGRVVVLAPFRL